MIEEQNNINSKNNLVKKIYNFFTSGVSIITILNIFLCFSQIFNIGIQFNYADKVVIICMTIISTQYLAKNITFLNRNIWQSTLGIILTISLCLYATFAICGSYFFLNTPVVFATFIKFILVFIGISPIVLSILTLFLKSAEFKFDKNTSSTNRIRNANLIFWSAFILVMISATIYVIVYNPAISSYDTMSQLYQALGVTKIANWHTPFHTLLIRFFLSIYNHLTFIVFIQSLFFAFVIASGCKLLYIIGISRKILIFYIFFLALSPNNAIHFVTIWKDVPYAASLFWITILLARLIFGKYRKERFFVTKLLYFEIALCMVLICLLRQNGMIPFIFTIISVLLIDKFSKKAIISVSAAVIFVLLFLFPITKAFDVQDGVVGMKFIGLGQDIIGVEMAGGTLNEDAQNIVDVLTNTPDYTYIATYASSTYDLNISVTQFIKAYVTTFINNPIKMITAILNRISFIWDFTTGKNALISTVAYRGYLTNIEFMPIVSPERVELNIQLNKFINSVVELSQQGPLLFIFWRVGIYTFCILFSTVLLVIKKQNKIILLLLPIIGQIVSLILSTGWSDYRYFWPISLVSSYFLLITLESLRGKLYDKI